MSPCRTAPLPASPAGNLVILLVMNSIGALKGLSPREPAVFATYPLCLRHGRR